MFLLLYQLDFDNRRVVHLIEIVFLSFAHMHILVHCFTSYFCLVHCYSGMGMRCYTDICICMYEYEAQNGINMYV